MVTEQNDHLKKTMLNPEGLRPTEGVFRTIRENIASKLRGHFDKAVDTFKAVKDVVADEVADVIEFLRSLSQLEPREVATVALPILALLAGIGLTPGKVSAAEINQALNNRAGAPTQELTSEQLNDLQVAPTRTPTKTPTPTATATLASVLKPTVEATPTKTPTPEIIDMIIGTGVVTADSLNIRADFNPTATKLGSLTKNTEIQYKLVEKQPEWLQLLAIKQGGTWVDVTGEDTTQYVFAEYIKSTGNIKIEVTPATTVEANVGGQLDEKKMLAEAKAINPAVVSVTVEGDKPLAVGKDGNTLLVWDTSTWKEVIPKYTLEELAAARAALGENVHGINKLEAVWLAYDVKGNPLGALVNGVWQKSEGGEEVAPTVETASLEISYQDALAQFPELMSQLPTKLIDKETSISTKAVKFKNIDPTTKAYRFDGVNLTMVDQDGTKVLQSVTGNKDEALNSWAELHIKTDKFTIELGTRYNDPENDPMFEARKSLYEGKEIPLIIDIMFNTPELMKQVPEQVKYYFNQPASLQWFLEYRLVASDVPVRELPPAGDNYNKLVETFFKGVETAHGSLEIPVEVNGETVMKKVDPILPIRVVVNRFPGKLGWYNKQGESTTRATLLPNQYYDVVNNQLTVWVLDPSANGYIIGSTITYVLESIWNKLEIPADKELTLRDDNSIGVELYPELRENLITFYADGNTTYLLQTFLTASSGVNAPNSPLEMK